MSNNVIAVIFIILLVGAGIFFFGRDNGSPMQMGQFEEKETMNDAKQNTELDQTQGTHVMPDGTIMRNDSAMEGMHMMPDGSMMHN